MFWDHLEQANERLRRTVVCYGGSPYLIEELSQPEDEVRGHCYAPHERGAGRLEAISLEDPLWEDFRKLPSLGLVNTLNGVYFLARLPRRGMRHGLSNENTIVSKFDPNRKAISRVDLSLSQFFMYHSLFWDMACKNDYPSFEECLENIVVGGAVAFSRKHFLCRREKSVFELYREESQIGLVVRNQPILYSNKRFFREELEQVHGLRNIQEE